MGYCDKKKRSIAYVLKNIVIWKIQMTKFYYVSNRKCKN